MRKRRAVPHLRWGAPMPDARPGPADRRRESAIVAARPESLTDGDAHAAGGQCLGLKAGNCLPACAQSLPASGTAICWTANQ